MTTKNSSIQNQLIADFHGTKLTIVKHNSEPYVSTKEIALAMGLDWKTQYRKLNSCRDRWSMVKMTIETNAGKRCAICMPLRKLPGWLMTIQVKKLSNELRPKIIQYQKECDDVLWQHWNKSHQPAPVSNNNPDLMIIHKSVLEETGSAIVTINDNGIQTARPVQPQAKVYITTIHDGQAPTMTPVTREYIEIMIREHMPEYALLNTTVLAEEIGHIKQAMDKSNDLLGRTTQNLGNKLVKLEAM